MNHDALATALAKYPEATAEMIGQATCLVAAQAVTPSDDDYYNVAEYEDLQAARVKNHIDKTGTITPTLACSCVDDPFDESNAACAHVLAVALYEALRVPVVIAQGDIVSEERMREYRNQEGTTPPLHGAVMTEAPYSLNVSVEDPDGYQYQLTVRKQESKAFFAAASGLRQWIKAQGFAPVQRGGFTRQAPVQEKAPQQPEAPRQEQSEQPPARTTTPPQRQPEAPGGKVYRFHAETLLKSEMNGKIIWAIQGNDIPAYCRKYGMRVWPEVLEHAGFDPGALEEVRQANLPSLHGYVAEYTMRADDPQKPDKIIALWNQGV